MPYALIDDQMYDHPKFVGLSDAAVGLWTRGLSWCTRHLTDGVIPKSAVAKISSSGDRARASCVRELLAAGLWDDAGESFSYHDFSHHNPSAAKVKARRDEVSEAKARAGRKGAKARWGNGKQDGTPDGKPIADRMANGWQTDSPVPVPVPPLLTTTRSSSGRSVELPSPTNEVVGVCSRCDCPDDRPGAYELDGVDVICDHTVTADAYLA